MTQSNQKKLPHGLESLRKVVIVYAELIREKHQGELLNILAGAHEVNDALPYSILQEAVRPNKMMLEQG